MIINMDPLHHLAAVSTNFLRWSPQFSVPAASFPFGSASPSLNNPNFPEWVRMPLQAPSSSLSTYFQQQCQPAKFAFPASFSMSDSARLLNSLVSLNTVSMGRPISGDLFHAFFAPPIQVRSIDNHLVASRLTSAMDSISFGLPQTSETPSACEDSLVPKGDPNRSASEKSVTKSGDSLEEIEDSNENYDSEPLLKTEKSSTTSSAKDSCISPPSKKQKLGYPPQKNMPNSEVSENTQNGYISNLQGDRRLVIAFESFGTIGSIPQNFGKSGLLIPDGLTGTHTAYQEQWRFEIHHSDLRVPGTDLVCITWKITNIQSGVTQARTENANEAMARLALGWTISSKLFREAMSERANQLEERLSGESNECRIAKIKSLIKVLRPKTFTQGPLIFGLKHRIVQEKIGNVF